MLLLQIRLVNIVKILKLCIKITDDNDSVLTTSDYVSFSIPEHIDNYNIGC
jgi:hypothetical protein